MQITATFAGQDGSLGYRKGVVYTLKLRNTGGVTIRRSDGSGACPYASLSAFFRNWKDVRGPVHA